MQDDSGAYAVFTEQGSSALQMTANSCGCYSQTTWMRLSIDRRISVYTHIIVGRTYKFWTLSSDYQDAQDKRATQYPPFPKIKWRMLQHCWNFPSPSVLTCGYVYHGTNGHNHGTILKNQPFLLDEIHMVTSLQVCYGQRQSQNIYSWKWMGETTNLVNAQINP